MSGKPKNDDSQSEPDFEDSLDFSEIEEPERQGGQYATEKSKAENIQENSTHKTATPNNPQLPELSEDDEQQQGNPENNQGHQMDQTRLARLDKGKNKTSFSREMRELPPLKLNTVQKLRVQKKGESSQIQLKEQLSVKEESTKDGSLNSKTGQLPTKKIEQSEEEKLDFEGSKLKSESTKGKVERELIKEPDNHLNVSNLRLELRVDRQNDQSQTREKKPLNKKSEQNVSQEPVEQPKSQVSRSNPNNGTTATQNSQGQPRKTRATQNTNSLSRAREQRQDQTQNELQNRDQTEEVKFFVEKDSHTSMCKFLSSSKAVHIPAYQFDRRSLKGQEIIYLIRVNRLCLDILAQHL